MDRLTGMIAAHENRYAAYLQRTADNNESPRRNTLSRLAAQPVTYPSIHSSTRRITPRLPIHGNLNDSLSLKHKVDSFGLPDSPTRSPDSRSFIQRSPVHMPKKPVRKTTLGELLKSRLSTGDATLVRLDLDDKSNTGSPRLTHDEKGCYSIYNQSSFAEALFEMGMQTLFCLGMTKPCVSLEQRMALQGIVTGPDLLPPFITAGIEEQETILSMYREYRSKLAHTSGGILGRWTQKRNQLKVINSSSENSWDKVAEMSETLKRDLLIRTFSEICTFANIRILILAQNYLQKDCFLGNKEEIGHLTPDLLIIIIEKHIFKYGFEIGLNIEPITRKTSLDLIATSTPEWRRIARIFERRDTSSVLTSKSRAMYSFSTNNILALENTENAPKIQSDTKFKLSPDVSPKRLVIRPVKSPSPSREPLSERKWLNLTNDNTTMATITEPSEPVRRTSRSPTRVLSQPVIPTPPVSKINSISNDKQERMKEIDKFLKRMQVHDILLRSTIKDMPA